MSKKQKFNIILLVFISFTLLIIANIGILNVYSLQDNLYTSYNEINEINKERRFGNLVELSMKKNLQTGSEEEKEGYVVVKLFGFIPIKKVKVKLLPEDQVYLGGVPIGLTVYTEGVVVVSDAVVDVANNKIVKNKQLENGDIIKKIGNVIVENVDDVEEALKSVDSDNVEVELLRDDKVINTNVGLIKNKNNEYKLGVWVKNDISGIGTLTFVKKKDLKYGALGHPITNGADDSVVPITTGNVYSCNLIGVNKGQRNKPGELRGVFVKKNEKGDITKNTPYGIFGNIEKKENVIDENRCAKIGGRLSVKPGKAKLISSVSGICEEYDIEIIKASYQTKCSDKSIVFRVKDKRLLELTGGIVQGMSGSPIVQNGKLVGAVTHVFMSDPTKGYAVYSDWMLEQID